RSSQRARPYVRSRARSLARQGTSLRRRRRISRSFAHSSALMRLTACIPANLSFLALSRLLLAHYERAAIRVVDVTTPCEIRARERLRLTANEPQALRLDSAQPAPFP